MNLYNINSFKPHGTGDSYVKNSVMVFGNKKNIWEGKIEFNCSKYSDTVFIKLDANEIIPYHKHFGSEEVAFVLSGDGFFNYDNKKNKIKKDDLIFFEDSSPHDYIAGKNGLSLIVFHAPSMKDRQLVK